MIEPGPVDYAAGAPDWYVCEKCAASGVRLYRMYQTFSDRMLLHCTACALENQRREQPDNESAHSIGWLVAAVPTENGGAYWGYTSVPQAGVDWWDRLPVGGVELAKGGGV